MRRLCMCFETCVPLDASPVCIICNSISVSFIPTNYMDLPVSLMYTEAYSVWLLNTHRNGVYVRVSAKRSM